MEKVGKQSQKRMQRHIDKRKREPLTADRLMETLYQVGAPARKTAAKCRVIKGKKISLMPKMAISALPHNPFSMKPQPMLDKQTRWKAGKKLVVPAQLGMSKQIYKVPEHIVFVFRSQIRFMIMVTLTVKGCDLAY